MTFQLNNINIHLRRTKTYIWDIEDLENPILLATHLSAETSIDHNQYIKGNYVSVDAVLLTTGSITCKKPLNIFLDIPSKLRVWSSSFGD